MVYVGTGVGVGVGVAVTSGVAAVVGTAVVTSMVGTAVGTAVKTSVGVGVATGVAGWDVHPANRIPINRTARTTKIFFMHVFLLSRYISIFYYGSCTLWIKTTGTQKKMTKKPDKNPGCQTLITSDSG
jgi:hypothetical protein